MSYKQAVEGLREDTAALGHRVETVETGQEDIIQTMEAIQDATRHYEEVLNSLLDQLYDYENRDRHQNIHIRNLPEATRAPDLLLTMQDLFLQIFWDSAPDNIEVDRIHRVLLPAFNNIAKPRDVICRLHRYSV